MKQQHSPVPLVIFLILIVGLLAIPARQATLLAQTHRSATTDIPGLVGSWPFDENSGSTTHDATGGTDGQITNGMWVNGKSGSAIRLSGNDSYVLLPNTNALNLTTEMTLSAWVNPESLCAGNNPILQKNNSYGLKIYETGQAIGFIWSGFELHRSTTLLSTNQWYYLTATFSNGVHRIYVNGVLENQATDSVTTIPSSTSPIYIGKGDFGCNFTGAIDQVQIYQRALTSAEIQTLYEAFIAPDMPGTIHVQSTTASNIALAWTDTATNEDGYRIYRATSAAEQAQLLTTLGPNSTTLTDTAVECGRDYYYEASAYNANGESARTPRIKATTAACLSSGVIPVAPKNVAIHATTESSIVLTWTDTVTNEDTFTLYRALGPTEDVILRATLPQGSTTFTDTALECGRDYFYEMSASNTYGESAHTPRIKGTTPACREPFTRQQWRWDELKLPETSINALAVNPSHAAVAFLASNEHLYRTTDAGDTWMQVTMPNNQGISSVAIAGQRVYAYGSQLFRSDDDGTTWTQQSPIPNWCGTLLTTPSADRLYAQGCDNGSQTILRSDDGGHTWVSQSTPFGQFINIAVSPEDANLLVATEFDKAWKSNDGGASWSTLAIGQRYRLHVSFDMTVPTTIYLGHWTGLLRSTDSGQTWQDSSVDRETQALVAAPFAKDTVLGTDGKMGWQLTSIDNAWTVQDWNIPTGVKFFARAANDDSVVYAHTQTGLWRYRAEKVAVPYAIMLPVVIGASTVEVATTLADKATAQANMYRTRLGLNLLRTHPAIVTAAQNHADYRKINSNDPSADAFGAHGEVAGKPGFTGKWPSDRLPAAGYPWFGGAEIMYSGGDPISSVDVWMATVYHRLVIIDPQAHYTGYATSTDADVMDFGSGPTNQGVWISATPFPLGYPANKQTGVPTNWGGGESPNPLPPGTSTPVGYPFTLQGVSGKLVVEQAEMRDSQGQIVIVHPNPGDCGVFNCYAVIPVAPLRPNTTYTISVRGNVEGTPFDRTWTFTTGSSTSYNTK